MANKLKLVKVNREDKQDYHYPHMNKSTSMTGIKAMKKLTTILVFGFLSLPCFAAIGGGPGGISINFIENSGSTVTQRNTLNFKGTGVTCVDNAGNLRTDCTITSGGGGGSLSSLSDVTLTSPASNDLLVYNGTVWVNAPAGTSFTFGINTFSDSLPSTIEEGVGIWKAAGAINFTASYVNGPPIGSTITYTGWSNLPLASPFTSTTSVASVGFPSVTGNVVFTLSSQKSTTASANITHTFNNDRYWGISTLSSGWTSAQVLSFGSNDLSNSIPNVFTVTAGAGQYIVYAYPSRLGTATFSVGGFSGGFNPSSTVSVTNASGFTENYFVYSSVNPNLGNTTVTVTTP